MLYRTVQYCTVPYKEQQERDTYSTVRYIQILYRHEVSQASKPRERLKLCGRSQNRYKVLTKPTQVRTPPRCSTIQYDTIQYIHRPPSDALRSVFLLSYACCHDAGSIGLLYRQGPSSFSWFGVLACQGRIWGSNLNTALKRKQAMVTSQLLSPSPTSHIGGPSRGSPRGRSPPQTKPRGRPPRAHQHRHSTKVIEISLRYSSARRLIYLTAENLLVVEGHRQGITPSESFPGQIRNAEPPDAWPLRAVRPPRHAS